MTEDERTDDDGLGEQLRRLLEALDALDEDESAHASASGDVFGLDVDVDVEFGTVADSTDRSRDRSGGTRRPRRSRRRGPERGDESAAGTDYLVSVREREDGATVSVDLDGERAPPPTPAVDDGDLVLHRTGDLVETVALPFEDGIVARTSTNNGVLVAEVEKRPNADADVETDADVEADADVETDAEDGGEGS